MKLLFSFLICILFSSMLSAQSFFKPLPKIQTPPPQRNAVTRLMVTATDSTYGALRPIVLTGYSLPDNHVMAGAGFGYQNVTYTYATQRSYVNWSVNLVSFAGGALSPKDHGEVISYGIMIGALNNLVMAGAALNDGKVQFVVSFGINFNN